MKQSLIIFLIFVFFPAFSQKDTIIYYSNRYRTVLDKDNASYYERIVAKKNNQYQLLTYKRTEKEWDKIDEEIFRTESDSSFSIKSDGQGRKKSIRCYRKIDGGYYIRDYVDGILHQEGPSLLIFPAIKYGNWKTYDDKIGKIRMEGFYSENQMISNKYWISDNNFISDVFNNPDKMAEYEGGISSLMKYVVDNLKYPASAMESGITGRVVIGFIVMSDGTVSGLHFIERVAPILDFEALRVVNSIPGKWTPAEVDNKKVNSAISLPISFGIEVINNSITISR